MTTTARYGILCERPNGHKGCPAGILCERPNGHKGCPAGILCERPDGHKGLGKGGNYAEYKFIFCRSSAEIKRG